MTKDEKREINEMLFLMERMDKHYTGLQVEALKENIEQELDARGRRDMNPSEFFTMSQRVRGGVKSTIGYVSAANLNFPQVKKVNPATNRIKSYNDFESFGKSINAPAEVGGVIKFARYTLNWRSPSDMHDYYEKTYVEPANNIRQNYGLSPIAKQANPSNTPGGSVVFPFFMQNTGGKDCKTVSMYFLVGVDGKIIKYPGTPEGNVPTDVLKNYFKQSEATGVADLRKMNVADEKIKAYADELAKIPFKYTRFNSDSVVYVITTINGEKLRFFNDNLSNCIKDIKIDPQEFLNLAKKLYKIDSQTAAAAEE